MLKEERYNHILQKLVHNRRVTLSELSSDLMVSEDTVRRDIEALSKDGRLTRVRGGAIPHSPNARLHAFKDRIKISEQDKEVIARKALTLLQNDQTILLDGGTTTYIMAGLLPADVQLTVVTNNIPIANLLMDHPSVQVILAGGRVFKSSQVTVGMETCRFLEKIRVDICFTGICSLHEVSGISGPDYDEAEVKRVMMQSANRVVAITTQNKIGTAEPFKICDIGNVDTIITEADPASDLFAPYLSLGINIM